jgi:shikimate kinase
VTTFYEFINFDFWIFFMNVVLIGYRCAGKSTVGRKLAVRMGKCFVDTDELVEKRQGLAIYDIVQTKGWAFFRAVEKKIIEEVSRRDDLIIAPGGGSVLDAENVRSLRENGLIIWLKADRHILGKRMEQDPRSHLSRPTLTGRGAMEEMGEVMASRTPFYEGAADAKLDTSALDEEEAVEAVRSIIWEKMGGSHWAGIHSEHFSG